MTMWCRSKRIRGPSIASSRLSFAITNRVKPRQTPSSASMVGKNSGWSACFRPKGLILNAGRGRKLSSVLSGGDVRQSDVPSIGLTISALSRLPQDSVTVWCEGIGALKIDCIGRKMWFSMKMTLMAETQMPCSMPHCCVRLRSI